MKRLTLKVKLREKTGKGYARKLRREGMIPAILYGSHLKESVSLELEKKELKDIMSHRSPHEQILNLDIVNQKANRKREVIVKSAQRNWLRGGIQHIDFLEITRGEKLTTTVSFSFVGKTQGEKIGGIVEHLVREVEVECLPRDIPAVIEVDVSSLDIGDSLKVKDVKVPPQVKVLTHLEETVVAVVAPAPEEEAVAEEEKEEGVPAEEVELVDEQKEKEEEDTEKKES